MEPRLVLARAFKDRPLKRLLLEVDLGKGFICSPATYEDCCNGQAHPVGFPVGDLYEFDESLFSRLESAARRRDKRILEIWADAKPLIEREASRS